MILRVRVLTQHWASSPWDWIRSCFLVAAAKRSTVHRSQDENRRSHRNRSLSGSITRDQQFRGLSTVEEIGGENASAINTMMSSKIAIQFAYALVIGIRNHDGSTTAYGFLNADASLSWSVQENSLALYFTKLLLLCMTDTEDPQIQSHPPLPCRGCFQNRQRELMHDEGRPRCLEGNHRDMQHDLSCQSGH